MQSALYRGWVSHRRRGPAGHAFRYRTFMVWLDLAELAAAFRGRWFWSASRPALARFRREDYLMPHDRPLDEAVRDLVAARTAKRPAGAVRGRGGRIGMPSACLPPPSGRASAW